MSLPVKIRRGSRSQLNSYGLLQIGELGFVTDENIVVIGDGSANILVGRALSGAGAPTGNGISGNIYIDTTTSGMYFSGGAGWIPISASLSGMAGDLDDISDGSVYKKTLATEVSNGKVIRLDDGTYSATASGVSTHISDSTIHRSINDSATSSTSLWSSTKVNETIHSLIDGLDYQSSVLSKTVSSPPGSPAEGARYIIPISATDGWSGKDNQVTEYRSAAWVYIVPNKGYCCVVEDDSNKEWVYNGTTWIVRPATEDHNSLINKQGGSGSDFYHLGLSDYAALTTNRDQTVQTTISGMVAGNTETGIAVDVVNGKMNFVIALSDLAPNATISGTASAGSSAQVARQDHTHKTGLHPIFDVSFHDMSSYTHVGDVIGVTSAGQLGTYAVIDGGTFA